MILYNSEIKDNIFVYEFLKKKYKDEIVIKGNIIYLQENVDINNWDNNKVEIENLDDHLYYYLNHDIAPKYVDCLKKSDTIKKYNKKCELEVFEKMQSKFFPKGNNVILYFSTDYVKNPLDILYTLSINTLLENEYHSVKADYIPYKNKIIYYLLFRYSTKLKPNLKDILKNVDKYNSIENLVSNLSVFPKIQTEFQNHFFEKYPDFKPGYHQIKHEGVSTFSPYYSRRQ